MKILIIDDDHLVTQSLQTIIHANSEIEVIAIGHSAFEAVQLYDRYQPDVLLMDIRMGEKTGIDAAKEILAFHPKAAILFLTTFSDDDYIIDALKIGAKGYLLKQNFEAIVPALRSVYKGQSVFGNHVVDKLPKLFMKDQTNSFESYEFTEREVSILTCVAEGLNNKEIAVKLFLSEGTIRNYISALLEKLKLRDRTQLAIFYYKTHQ